MHQNDTDNATLARPGSQGMVYEGIWQGASVAVKWSVVDKLDANASELLFGKMLSHPNVVQTFDAKIAVLNAEVSELTPGPQSGRGSCSACDSDSDGAPG